MINVTERTPNNWVYSEWQVSDGFRLAFDTEKKWTGVVNEDGTFFPVLRLNGWRARTLAEMLTGKYDANKLTLGSMWAVWSESLQALPDFDSTQQAIANSFKGEVAIEVVTIDPGYGPHIKIVGGK